MGNKTRLAIFLMCHRKISNIKVDTNFINFVAIVKTYVGINLICVATCHFQIPTVVFLAL